MSATSSLLDFASEAWSLPSTARADTLRLLADTLAVGAAGSTAAGADGVYASAASWGDGNEARILGRAARLPAPSAAFINAFQIHCLEWDAVHEGAVVHALSVVTAALHGVIDRRGRCDAEDALTALAIGVDIASGLGIAADSALTFFRPATAGLIGAALAIARIEQLSRDQFSDILGLAYSHCAGTMQAHVEGSIALPLQIANAARAAVQVVDLVKHGLTGPHDALEGAFGYFKLIDQGHLSRYTGKLGDVWQISEVSTKPYPSGRASHAVLAALDKIRSSHNNIIQVTAYVPPLVARLIDRPMNDNMSPAYARLCLPFLTALMLRDGCIDPKQFNNASFTDPLIRYFAAMLRVEIDHNPDPNALSPQRLEILYANGERSLTDINDTLGSPTKPLKPDQIGAKCNLCADLTAHIDRRLFDDPLAYFTEPQ
jgi:2-methylcitrate dehydratase PrpD